MGIRPRTLREYYPLRPDEILESRMFSKRHYVFVARVLNSHIKQYIQGGERTIDANYLTGLLSTLACAFEQDNPVFSKFTFYQAVLDGIRRVELKYDEKTD